MMGTKRTEKACATRKQLLEAALAVIGEKGYSAATVDEIVDAAGVSKGVAYYHFKSKAVMAESILEEGIGGLIEGFERIAAEAPTAPEALTGMVELFATSIFENKAFGRFFVSELWREGRVWSRSMRDYEGRLLDVLEGQLARGQRISSDTPTPPQGCWGRRGESVSGSEFGIVRDAEFFGYPYGLNRFLS